MMLKTPSHSTFNKTFFHYHASGVPGEGKEELQTDDCICERGRRHGGPALQTPSPQP